MQTTLFIAVVLVALVSTFFGFALEVVQGNIRHVKNGRKPEAGAAVFPSVIIIPLFYAGAAWGLNSVSDNLGFYVVFAYFVGSMLYKIFSLKKAGRYLKNCRTATSNLVYISCNLTSGPG